MHLAQTAGTRRLPPLRLAVYIASAILFCVMVGITVYRAVHQQWQESLLVLLGNTALWLVPFVARPLFKEKISDSVYAIFVVFSFFASFLGTVMGFYGSVWWYDLVMHFIFGWLACYIGLFFACKLAPIDRLRPLFVILFCFAVSLMFAALWEIFEFSGDVLIGNNAQGNPILTAEGNYVIDVTDTMEDILCNTCGALLFVVHYAAHTFSGRSLLLSEMKRDFSIGRKLTPAEQSLPTHASVQED